jgi:hypothetical protein
MAISINNGIANIDGTPGAISGVFSNRPAAADLANGTLYFATDTAEIYQTVSGIWVNYAGGGGGTPGIDDVLSVGQLLTNNRFINASNFQLDIALVKICNIFSNNGTTFFVQDDVIATSSNTASGFGFFVDFAQRNLRLGDAGSSNNTTILNVDDFNSQVYSQFTGIVSGLKLDFANKIFDFGDVAGLNSFTSLRIDDQNQIITLRTGSSTFGLTLDFFNDILIFGDFATGSYLSIDNSQIARLYATDTIVLLCGDSGLVANNAGGFTIIGDHDGLSNSTTFGVNDLNQTLLASANLLTPNTTGQSGQYLKINVGGTDYVIDLRNP